MTNNSNVDRYIVYHPGYNAEEGIENFSSYSTRLDNIPGMTKAYSQAIASSNHMGGKIFAQKGDVITEVIRAKTRN